MYYCIINPSARSGRLADAAGVLEQVLSERHLPCQRILTEGPGHAMETVRRLTSPDRNLRLLLRGIVD